MKILKKVKKAVKQKIAQTRESKRDKILKQAVDRVFADYGETMKMLSKT